MAKLVAGGITLRNQVNKAFPKRDKSSDGWIGDKAHQARGAASDHNPDSRDLVHALDIDADFGPPGANYAQKLADQLVAYAASGKPGSNRIKYVVYNDRIASGTYANSRWVWRGSGYGHRHHIHVSFTTKGERDYQKFPLPILGA